MSYVFMSSENSRWVFFRRGKWRVHYRGYGFTPSEEKLERDSLANYFLVNTFSEFQTKLKSLNGFFAVIVETETSIFAAVDQIRSVPLFYSREDTFFISEQAQAIRRFLADEAVDSVAREEFLLTGYVTGQDTLAPGVKQLQAGECLVWRKAERHLLTHRYYLYTPSGDLALDEAALFAKFATVYESVFTRLIRFLDGRTAVIPLSGGHDSRLVAVMLKSLGYENVLCFTYDTGGGRWESELSRQVAQKLGYSWHYVSPPLHAWRTWYQSKQFQAYQAFAFNLSSLPHQQDYLAVKYLLAEGCLPEDSVFIPGHTGDFLAGSYLPVSWRKQDTFSLKSVIDAVEKKHYLLWPLDTNKRVRLGAGRIVERLCTDNVTSFSEAARASESWVWQERQAKFIVNSVRIYDWFGLDWSLPFWDKEIISLWAAIPFEMRFGKSLHIRYVNHLFPTEALEPNPKISKLQTYQRKGQRLLFKGIRYSGTELLATFQTAQYQPLLFAKAIIGNGAASQTLLYRFEKGLLEPDNTKRHQSDML